MSLFAFPSSLSPRKRTLLDLLLLTLLCLFFFWRDLPWAGVDHRGFAAGDFGNQFFAFASYKAARLHLGQLPLWSPYALGGHPFLADIQSAVFYPVGLLTVLVTAFTGFSYGALQVEAVLHIPLAAAGMYLLAQRLTGSRIGAWVAAVVFAFSSYLTGYPMLQLAILETVAWTPLILLALDLAVAALTQEANLPQQLPSSSSAEANERPALTPRVSRSQRTAIGWTLVAGLLMGIALLAGHPQSAMLVFYGSVAFALFRYFTAERSRAGSPVGPIAGALALFSLVTLGIAASQLVPSLEYMRLSTRAGMGIDAAGRGFTPYDLFQFVLPQVSVPFAALYVGVLPLGLALFALAQLHTGQGDPSQARQTRALTVFVGGLILVSLLLSFGTLTPLYHLAYLLAPGWRLFRQQERLAVWIVFGLALLAGLAATALHRIRRAAPDPMTTAGQETGDVRWLIRGYWVGAAGAALFAVVCLVGFVAGVDKLWGFAASGAFLALLLVLAALALRSRHPAWIIALIVLDLFALTGRQHAGDAASAVVFPPALIFSTIASDKSDFRTADEDVLPGNFGYGYGLADINGISPLRLSAYDRLLHNAPKPLLWRLLAVKYVVTWRNELEVPAERVAEQPAKDGEPAYAYRLAATNPRAWLAGEALVEADAERQQERVLEQGFDPARQVVLDRLPQPAPQPGCTGSVEWLARAPESLALTVAADTACVLVLSEIAYPGWEATVDDAPAPILTADAILRGVAVSPGQHRVELNFRPRSVTVGLALSGLTLLAVLIALVWIWRMRSKT